MKIEVQCFSCGKHIEIDPDEFEGEKDCPYCGEEDMGGNVMKTEDKFCWFPQLGYPKHGGKSYEQF